jgi:hypothetical protein
MAKALKTRASKQGYISPAQPSQVLFCPILTFIKQLVLHLDHLQPEIRKLPKLEPPKLAILKFGFNFFQQTLIKPPSTTYLLIKQSTL